jgi:selenocysteine lyase/cysteine desulfurase
MNHELLKKEFPLEDDLIYLNHAAVAPWPARTREAVKHFADENARSGAYHYTRWLQKETELRKQIQLLLNAPSPDDIALLKNTSESLSIVAAGLDWRSGDNVVSTYEEFPSNRIPWQALAGRAVQLREVPINVDRPEQALIDACDRQTRLLTVSSVQYGSGTRLDLETLGRYCRRHDILFCVDAIQSLGAIAMDVQAIHADFVMADGHKWLLGPEGLALFYTTPAARDRLTLQQYGWHMVEQIDFNSRDWRPSATARRFECGSPNMLGIHALSASVSLLAEIGMQEVQETVLRNSAHLIERLEKVHRTRVLTPRPEQRHAGIVTFQIEGRDLAQLQQHLWKNKVLCVYRGGGLRFSPHFYISEQLLDKAIDILVSSI